MAEPLICRLKADSCEPKKRCITVQDSYRKGTFESDMCQPIVAYLRLAACTHMPHLPVQRAWQTSTLTITRDDNMCNVNAYCCAFAVAIGTAVFLTNYLDTCCVEKRSNSVL